MFPKGVENRLKEFYEKEVYTFSKRQILYSSNLKHFADDNFRFDENDREFSKRVENTVGKGEIARYEQFLLFPWCFGKMYFRHIQTKQGLVWESFKLVTTIFFIFLQSFLPFHFDQFLFEKSIKVIATGCVSPSPSAIAQLVALRT